MALSWQEQARIESLMRGKEAPTNGIERAVADAVRGSVNYPSDEHALRCVAVALFQAHMDAASALQWTEDDIREGEMVREELRQDVDAMARYYADDPEKQEEQNRVREVITESLLDHEDDALATLESLEETTNRAKASQDRWDKFQAKYEQCEWFKEVTQCIWSHHDEVDGDVTEATRTPLHPRPPSPPPAKPKDDDDDDLPF